MPSEQSGKPAAPTMVIPSRHSWEAGAMLGPEWAMKTYHTGLAWGYPGLVRGGLPHVQRPGLGAGHSEEMEMRSMLLPDHGQ